MLELQPRINKLRPKEYEAATFSQVNGVFKEIKGKLIEGLVAKPKKLNYVVILLFAGHGILKDGMQALVLNEYDNKTGFYKLFKAEDTVRKLSYVFNLNSYFICSFACCRELFDPVRMKGCIDGNKVSQDPASTRSEVVINNHMSSVLPKDLIDEQRNKTMVFEDSTSPLIEEKKGQTFDQTNSMMSSKGRSGRGGDSY